MGRIRDTLRDILNPTPKTTAADVAKVQERARAEREGLEKAGDPGGFLTPQRTSGGGSGGTTLNVHQEALQLELQRQAREKAQQRQAELQRQRQIELQRQADIKRQADAQKQAQQTRTIQQAVVTSRTPTLSSGGTPIRDEGFGKSYADYQKRLQAEAQKKGRNLYASERESIAEDVFQPKKLSPAQEMVTAIDKTARGEISPKDLRPKELRLGFQGFADIYGGVKTGVGKTKQWILEHKDNKVISFLAETKTPQERTRDFFATHRSPQVALRDLYVSESKEVKKGILEQKDTPLFTFFAETKTPQERVYTFFGKTKTPQERTGEFFTTHRSPQEVIGESIPLPVLEKAGSIKIPVFIGAGSSIDVTTPIGMVTDIEKARVKTAPEKTSGHFFFEKLAESNVVTGDIQKAYKQSEKETGREFFTEQLGEGYKKAYTDIVEVSLYKGTRLFAQKRDPTYVYQTPSRVIGAGFGKVGEFQLYAVPGVGQALFVSPFIEKGIEGRGALGGYVKAHPYETAFALGSVVVPSTLYATKRITTIAPTRKIIEPSFVEKQVYGISKGKEYKFSTYDIVGEYKPPRIKLTTSRFRQQLGLKPITTKTFPAQKFSIKTTSPAINNFPFQVVETRTSSNILRYKTIQGDSILVNPRVSKLNKIDEFLLKRYVEGKTKLPTSIETAKVYTPRGTQFEISDISAVKTYKYNVKAKKSTFIDNRLYKDVDAKSFKVRIGDDKTYAELDFGKVKFESGRGKTTDTSRALTRSKQIVDTPEYEVLSSESYFKDVSKPGARATGKTPRLTGEIYIKKEPIFIDKVSDVTFINTADIVKTPLSKTFQIQKEVTPLTKIVPKIPPTKTITKIAPSPTISRVVPGAVPGVVTKSKFFGTQFAPQEDLTMTQKFTSIGATIQPPTFLQGKIPSNQLKDLSFTKQVGDTKLISKGLTKTLTKQQPKLMTKDLSKTLTKTPQKEITKEITKVLQKQQQKQQQKQIQKQIFKTPPSLIFPGKTTKPPTKKPPGFPIFSGKGYKQPKKPTRKFKVLGRRFGKYRVVGTARTERGAFALGKKFARTTLGVTFKIPKAKRLKVPGFRTKKEDGGIVFIEPIGKRLKRGGSEVKEIKLYQGLRRR